MATAKTAVDALGFYLSGAYSDGATQELPDSCLGGYRSNVEVRRLDFLVRINMPLLRVDWVSGSNALGDGDLLAQGANSVAWQPANGTLGTSVTIANGESKLIVGGTKEDAIRVTRLSTRAMHGLMRLALLPVFNDLIGMDNVTSAEALAGLNTYRAGFLYNHGASDITGIKIWIKTLGTQRVTGTAQLSGSGSGTITTATANGFADWPTSGWAHIKNAGTTREIVYYTSRTATSLTVPAAGRARLGTSAGAGAGTDTIDAVPGIRIGFEAPSSSAIQTIANDATAPTGITWNAQTTSAAGLSLATLTAGSGYGLWIHRELPAGMVAGAHIENAINIEFVYSAAAYDTILKGRYKVANDALKAYLLYEGIDADPTFTTPTSTNASLPFTQAFSPPVSGTKEFREVVRYRNEYGLISLNRFIRRFSILSSGALTVTPPTAPSEVVVTDAGGGMLRVRARYDGASDDPAATQWAIRARGDGIDPTGSETPDLYDLERMTGMFMGRRTQPLNQLIGPYAPGQEVRVLVRTRYAQTATESTNTTATTVTVASDHVGAVQQRRAIWGAGYGLSASDSAVSRTEYIDREKDIYLQYESGYTELWADAVMVWRIRYDSGGSTRNGFWTTFGFVQQIVTGPKVICLGDSLTNYSGVPANEWPALVTTPHVTMQNEAVGATSSPDVVTKVGTIVVPQNPDLVNVEIFTNDIVFGASLATCQSRFATLAAALAGRRVLYFNVAPRSAFNAGQETIRNQFNAWLLTQGVTVIDFATLLADPGNTSQILAAYTFDGTHLTTAGKEVVAAYMSTYLAGLFETDTADVPATMPVKISCWNSDAKILYVTANGERVMKIDVLQHRIHAASHNQVLTALTSGAANALHDAGFSTLFQVYDPNVQGYATAIELDSVGRMRMRIPWRQRATTGDFL